MRVDCKVDVREVDGRQLPSGSKLTISVRTNLAVSSEVILEIAGKTYTVNGKDLMKAVRNVIES